MKVQETHFSDNLVGVGSVKELMSGSGWGPKFTFISQILKPYKLINVCCLLQ